MNVLQLSLRQFRNIEAAEFRPHPGVNFLLGENGQGKTSILEAIGLLSSLRSFRAGTPEEILRWGSERAEVGAKIAPGDTDSGVTASFDSELRLVLVRERREGSSSRFRKLASINGKPYPSSLQYLNQRFGNAALGFHAISFNPADHDLIRGEPATRRAYLDRVLAAEDSEYLATLRRYLKLVEQRNSLLKQNSPPSRPLLEGFTEPLAPLAATLVRQRLEWMSRLTQTLTETARKIAPEQGDLRLRYLSRWIPEKSEFSRNNRLLEAQHFSGLPHLPSLQILEDYFRKGMTRAAQTGAEARAKSTLVGPHRDDWSLDLSGFPLSHQPADFLKCESSTQEPRSLKGHGSQGEIRTALLALKLSEIALFRQKTGHKPLLLLDDFSSELDQRRRQFLLRFLAETDLQVFVTATELPADCGLTDLGRGTRYEVRQGKIKPL